MPHPGINNSSAFGGQGSYGNALLLDGVDTRDPEGDRRGPSSTRTSLKRFRLAAWARLRIRWVHRRDHQHDHEVRRECGPGFVYDALHERFIGIGERQRQRPPAEPRIGPVLGHQEADRLHGADGRPHQEEQGVLLRQHPALFRPRRPEWPCRQLNRHQPAVQFQGHTAALAGYQITFGTQYDVYNVTGRVGFWPSNQAGDDQTVTEDAPEWVWNAQYRHVFHSNSFLEAKFTGYTGYYYLDPVDPAPFTFDGLTNEYAGAAAANMMPTAAGISYRSPSPVRREVRPTHAEVRRGNRARPRPEPGPAVRPRRGSTSTPTAVCRTPGSTMDTTCRETIGGRLPTHRTSGMPAV